MLPTRRPPISTLCSDKCVQTALRTLRCPTTLGQYPSPSTTAHAAVNVRLGTRSSTGLQQKSGFCSFQTITFQPEKHCRTSDRSPAPFYQWAKKNFLGSVDKTRWFCQALL